MAGRDAAIAAAWDELVEAAAALIETPPPAPSGTRVARIGQPGSGKKRRRRKGKPLTCGVVVVELRGFEPLTPCMPLTSQPLAPHQLPTRHLVSALLSRPMVSRRSEAAHGVARPCCWQFAGDSQSTNAPASSPGPAAGPSERTGALLSSERFGSEESNVRRRLPSVMTIGVCGAAEGPSAARGVSATSPGRAA